MYFLMAYDRWDELGGFDHCRGIYGDLEGAITRANEYRTKSFVIDPDAFELLGYNYLFDVIEIWTIEDNSPIRVKRWTKREDGYLKNETG